MAKSDCVTCGRTLYYSHPALEAKGLFSPAWGSYLEKRYGKIGMRCLKCIGTENCIRCGQTLGAIGSVAGDKDGERDCFCGTEYCVDCVKSELNQTNTPSKPSEPDKEPFIDKSLIPAVVVVALVAFGAFLGAYFAFDRSPRFERFGDEFGAFPLLATVVAWICVGISKLFSVDDDIQELIRVGALGFSLCLVAILIISPPQ